MVYQDILNTLKARICGTEESKNATDHDSEMMGRKEEDLELNTFVPKGQSEKVNYYAFDHTKGRTERSVRGLNFLGQVMSSDEFRDGSVMNIDLLKYIYQRNTKGIAAYLNNYTDEQIRAIKICGQPLLHILCFKKNIDCLRLILSRGVDPNEINADGVTALHIAVNEEWTEGVKELLSFGASANTLPLSTGRNEWPYQEIPLLTAARNGDFATASILLNQNPDLSLKDHNRNTVLHLACYSHSVDLVSCLLKNKLILNEISCINNKGNTPLHNLMIGENLQPYEDEIFECLEMLLQNGANINYKNMLHKTPLYLAARANLVSVVKKLLESGADPTIITYENRSAFHAACHSGSHESLSLLLQNKKAAELILMEDCNGFAPFHVAVSSCSISCCEILLQNGDHLTRQDSKNRSRCSLVLNNMPSAKLLLKKMFDSGIEVSNKNQESPEFYVKMNFSVLLSNSSEDVEASIIPDLSYSNYECLFKHPLIESFLYHKWERIKWFFYINVFVFFLFLLVHTVYIIRVYDVYSSNKNRETISQSFYASYASLLITVLVSGSITFYANIKQYIKQWETYFRTIAMGTASYVVFSRYGHHRNEDMEEIIAAMSLFFTWIEFMMLLGRFPSLGVHILMFTRVAKSIIRFLLAFSSLLIGFALTFGILLSSTTVFKSFPTAFVKILMMMIGEIDYVAIYENSKDLSTFKLVLIHVFLVIFLFLIPILMANLLIGLAVNDLPDLQYHGKIRRLLKEASYLESYENLLLGLQQWTCFPNSVISLFSTRCEIRREITIYPNKLKKHKLKTSHVPSEAVKAAIDLGTNLNKEAVDLETAFKNFLKEYNNDRDKIERSYELLYETVTSKSSTREKPDLAGRFHSRKRLKTILRQRENKS